MAIENIVARTYDLGEVDTKVSEASSSGFQDVVDEVIVAKETETAQECNCNKQTTATEENIVDEVASENSVIGDAVAFSFSMFVSVSGDYDAVSKEIGRQFEHITSGFMHGLHSQGHGSPKKVDSYLQDAERAVSGGQESIGTFFEQMQTRRQHTLQSMSSNATTDNAFMSNISLSTNSALPGTSGSDLAKIYLDAASDGTSSQGGIYDMSATGNLSSGSSRDNYGLELISSSTSSLSSIINAVEKNDTDTIEQNNVGFMEKFIGMMDSFISDKKTGEFVDRAVVQPSLVSIEFGFDIHRYSTGLFNFTPKEPSDGDIENLDVDSADIVDKVAV